MSPVAILIAVFTAASNPTVDNCNAAASALAKQANNDASFTPRGEAKEIYWDEDMDLIMKTFKPLCFKNIKERK